jgi:hypothetical protein
VVGAIVEKKPELVLNIVVYQKNNLELAKARALSVKEYLLEKFPTIGPERLKASWFDVPQVMEAGGRSHSEPESVFLFTETGA